MKNISINKITKSKYKGEVFNLEIWSGDGSTRDDLFWIEQDSGIVTHNCFPKDVNAIICEAKEYGCDLSVMESVWKYNLENRKDKDWADIKGAVESE